MIEVALHTNHLVAAEHTAHIINKINGIPAPNIPKDLEERLLDEQIRLYLNENLPPLLSPESLLSYYDYYKSKPKFVSLYTENESGDPRVSQIINEIVEKMLIVNPLNRPSIHRIKSQFGKIIMQLLASNFFTSVTKNRQLISPTYQETN